MSVKINENLLLTSFKFINHKEFWLDKLSEEMAETNLFADNEKEINKLFTTLKKNNLVVVDLSEIDEGWREDFVYTILRLNKEKFKTKFTLVNDFETAYLVKKLWANRLVGWRSREYGRSVAD